MNEKNRTLGWHLKLLRCYMQINQTELGKLLGVSKPGISAMETDRVQPSAPVFIKILKLFKKYKINYEL